MHREIFHIGRFSLHSWGVMVALGFALGMWVAVRRAKKVGFPEKHIFDMSIALIIAAIVGSRLWYVFTHIEEFSGNWLDVINPFQGGGFGISGMAMVGGVVATIITAVIFCLIRKINFFEIGDIIAPTFLLGMFVGRWGCFLNGCCFGRESNMPWAVVFPNNSPAGSVFPGVRIHPTELYESFIDLFFFLMLVLWEKRGGKKFVGHSFWMAFFLYGIGRAIVDYWRWYEPQEIFFKYLGGNLSIHGAMALALSIVSLFVMIFRIGKPLPQKAVRKSREK